MATATATKPKRKTKTKAAGDASGSKPKRPAGAIAPPAFKLASFVEGREVVQLSTASLVRHPANRKPSPASVELVATNIESVGQLEPVIVRAVWNGDAVLDRVPATYQIISGETRWLAKRRLGHAFIDARVIKVDDAVALALVAAGNVARTDLTAIERAQLARDLMRPTGDVVSETWNAAGMSREQVAELLGLESAAAVSNLVRLLDAPEDWQRGLVEGWKVSAGEPLFLSEATTREAAKWAGVPTVLKRARENIIEQRVRHREQQLRVLEWVADDSLRYVDRKHYYGYQHGDHRCYLNLKDEALRARLQIVDTPNGPAALNVKLWDELQIKEIEKRKKTKDGGEKRGKDRADLTPAEARAADKAKQAKADEQLAAWAKEWRFRALRLGMARVLAHETAAVLLPWLVLATSRDYGGDVDDLLYAAAAGAAGSAGDNGKLAHSVTAHAAERIRAASEAEREPGFTVAAARLILWPAWNVAADGLGMEFRPNGFDDALPDRLPRIDDDEVEAWAHWLGVTVDGVWKRGEIAGAPERSLVEQLVARHTRAQLDQLGDELGVDIAPEATKTQAVEWLLAHHSPGEGLKVPAIAGPNTKRKRSR